MIASITLYANSIFANNINDILNRERLRRDKMVGTILKNMKNFKNIQKLSMQKIQYDQSQDDQKTIKEIGKFKKIRGRKEIKEIKNKYMDLLKKKGLIKKPPKAIVFVSLGMPDLSLKQIIQDANYYQIPVVIRGLYKNSFRKTFERIFDLAKGKNKGGILIDPKLFAEYDIKSVPAFVVSNSGSDYAAEKHKCDVVYGNIPLKKALSIIAERGNEARGDAARCDGSRSDASNVAHDILRRNQDSK